MISKISVSSWLLHETIELLDHSILTSDQSAQLFWLVRGIHLACQSYKAKTPPQVCEFNSSQWQRNLGEWGSGYWQCLFSKPCPLQCPFPLPVLAHINPPLHPFQRWWGQGVLGFRCYLENRKLTPHNRGPGTSPVVNSITHHSLLLLYLQPLVEQKQDVVYSIVMSYITYRLYRLIGEHVLVNYTVGVQWVMEAQKWTKTKMEAHNTKSN